VFDSPLGAEGAGFGVSANFIGDVDGDGADEITVAKPGLIVTDEDNPEIWSFRQPIIHAVYFSAARCSGEVHVPAAEADATVSSSDGVTGLTSRGLAPVTLLISVGDLDADGVSDVGALDYDPVSGGFASVFSGRVVGGGNDLSEADRMGAVLSGGDPFPLTEIGSPGDIDGDGVSDLLLGSLQNARTRLYSGREALGAGVGADTFLGELAYGLAAPGSGGDIDGDGLSDVALVVHSDAPATYEVDIWLAADVDAWAADAPPAAIITYAGLDRPWLDLDADGDGHNDVLLLRWPDDGSASQEIAVVLGNQLMNSSVIEDPYYRLQSGATDGLGLAGPRPVGDGDVLYEAGSDLGFRVADHRDIALGGTAVPASDALLPHYVGRSSWFPASGDADGDGQRDILAAISFDPAVVLFP
jgi:hypothetical protein